MRIIKKAYKKIVVVAVVASLMACSNEEPLTKSELDTSTPQMSDLDRWIATNYVDTYNISVVYKWDQNTVDNERFLFPPTESKVEPALDVVKRIWLDSYSTIAGPQFVKFYTPRELVLIGGSNLNPAGTVTLGFAEQGVRVVLFEIDLLNKKSAPSVKRFIETIQHEYAHILNQTKPFDELVYSKITPVGYTAAWNQTTTAAARQQGFITAYAKASVTEDFAEMVATMLTTPKADYNNLVNALPDIPKAAIRAKEAQVVKYYKDAFNIDFYALRDIAELNTFNVINN
jgi:substrate import-associated zinc metallohydrolase lipoprotein